MSMFRTLLPFSCAKFSKKIVMAQELLFLNVSFRQVIAETEQGHFKTSTLNAKVFQIKLYSPLITVSYVTRWFALLTSNKGRVVDKYYH